MSRNLLLSINITIAVLVLVHFFFNESDETVMLPIFSFLLFVTQFADFHLTRRKIEDGTFLKVGKSQGSSWWLPLFFGILWILLGTFSSRSHLHWHGIDGKVFLGVLFICSSIFRIKNYAILVKEKNIEFNEFMQHSEWPISKISKVIVKDGTVSFFKNAGKKEFAIGADELAGLKQYLAEKLPDKVVVE